MIPENKHTDEQLEMFALEILDFIKAQRKIIVDKIKDFHNPMCISPEPYKEECLLEFTAMFLTYVEMNLLQEINEI
jgi:hypothetical protein